MYPPRQAICMKPIKVYVPPLKWWFNILWNNMSVAQFCTVICCLVILRFTFYVRHHIWDLYRLVRDWTDWLTKRFQIANITSESISENELELFLLGNHGQVHTGDHKIGYDFFTFQGLFFTESDTVKSSLTSSAYPSSRWKPMSFWIDICPTTCQNQFAFQSPLKIKCMVMWIVSKTMPMSFSRGICTTTWDNDCKKKYITVHKSFGLSDIAAIYDLR